MSTSDKDGAFVVDISSLDGGAWTYYAEMPWEKGIIIGKFAPDKI